jgi:hypothetical protein
LIAVRQSVHTDQHAEWCIEVHLIDSLSQQADSVDVGAQSDLIGAPEP